MSKSVAVRPRLAIISSYGETCANASYAKALEEALGIKFDVEVLNLQSTSLMRLPGEDNVKTADQYIDSLCQRLKDFDLINLHLESCLYGNNLQQASERIIRLCNAAERLIVTVHKIYLDAEDKVHAKIDEEIINTIKRRADPNSYHFIVHVPREKELFKRKFGVDNVTDYPCLFMSETQRRYYKAKNNPVAWKKSIGLSSEDITIGRFGLLNDYKDHTIALKLLKILPQKYKVIYVGGAHPQNIKQRAIDPVIKDITDYLDKNPDISDRVIFMGSGISDEVYHTALCNIDVVLVPHFETYQSASAVTSVALELCRPIIASYNFTFMEYAKYFPDCFEFFNMGNHYEIKYKILNFDKNKLINLEHYAQQFTLDKLVDIYSTIYSGMKCSKHTPILHDPDLNNRIAAILRPANNEIQVNQAVNQLSPIRQVYNRLPEAVKVPLRNLKKALVTI